VQMQFAGTKLYEWSESGHGNYWSDNSAFDLDGDGIADTAYRPNNVVDWIVWRYPLAKLLLSSPAMDLLRAAQGQFPALYPGGVVDTYPLMAPPPAPRSLPPIPGSVEWVSGNADPGS
jgi:nitrous oxidase accessory protein